MEDTVRNSQKTAKDLAAFIKLHGGLDVLLIDVAEQSGWTDYFIISSVTSVTHMGGLVRQSLEKMAAEGIKPRNRVTIKADEIWCLVDFGDFILHLLTREAREFYELERLWYESPRIEVPDPV